MIRRERPGQPNQPIQLTRHTREREKGNGAKVFNDNTLLMVVVLPLQESGFDGPTIHVS